MTENQPGDISRLDLPYNNLILSGFLGVGKSTVGRFIARQLKIDLLDIDEEIELREVMSIAKIRELYGDSRLRMLEHDFCRQAGLMRRSIIVAPGSALLDERNLAILEQSGKIVVLTCELGEALRRLHLASEQHFRDETIRRRMMSRLRREYAIVNKKLLLQLNTTHLSIEEESEMLINLWRTGVMDNELFRYGPPPPIKAPEKPVTGLSTRWAKQANKPK